MPRCAEAVLARGWQGARSCLVALLLPLALLTGAAACAQDLTQAASRRPGEVPALDEREALSLAQAAVGRLAPDIEMRDRNGRLVSLSAYRGKPLLVSFIYTGCFQVCPAQTRELYEAVRGLDRMLGESQFNVVSIGFNQPFDTPEAMRSFAAQHRIAHRNWEFLSPDKDQVGSLARTFGFSWVATPAGFDHILGVTVVDASGRIHAQVLGNRLRADKLGVPMRELLLRQAPNQPQGVRGLIERVRILCTVYDAESGEYRYDVKLILEILSGVLFFVSVLTYLLLEWRRQRRVQRLACASASVASGITA